MWAQKWRSVERYFDHDSLALKRLCGVQQDRPRTFKLIIDTLIKLNTHGGLPRLKSDVGCEEDDSEDEIWVKG
jgi:hypothetical protein